MPAARAGEGATTRTAHASERRNDEIAVVDRRRVVVVAAAAAVIFSLALPRARARRWNARAMRRAMASRATSVTLAQISAREMVTRKRAQRHAGAIFILNFGCGWTNVFHPSIGFNI
jgi:hypothetical protein